MGTDSPGRGGGLKLSDATNCEGDSGCGGGENPSPRFGGNGPDGRCGCGGGVRRKIIVWSKDADVGN